MDNFELNVSETPEELRITIDWVDRGTRRIAMFSTLAVAGITIFLLLLDLLGVEVFSDSPGLEMSTDRIVIFAALAALVVPFIAYFLLQKTTFSMTNDSLTVRHHPLPWTGNRTISTGEIQDILWDYQAGTGLELFTCKLAVMLTSGQKQYLASGSYLAPRRGKDGYAGGAPGVMIMKLMKDHLKQNKKA